MSSKQMRTSRLSSRSSSPMPNDHGQAERLPLKDDGEFRLPLDRADHLSRMRARIRRHLGDRQAEKVPATTRASAGPATARPDAPPAASTPTSWTKPSAKHCSTSSPTPISLPRRSRLNGKRRRASARNDERNEPRSQDRSRPPKPRSTATSKRSRTDHSTSEPA